MKYVKQMFDDELNDEDFFGYISLDSNKQANKDEIILEKRSSNTKMKRRLMSDIRKREIDYTSSMGSQEKQSSKTIRLELALEKALEWQNTLVQDYTTRINERDYIGPHKWVLCLLGSDIYAVN